MSLGPIKLTTKINHDIRPRPLPQHHSGPLLPGYGLKSQSLPKGAIKQVVIRQSFLALTPIPVVTPAPYTGFRGSDMLGTADH